MRRENVLDGASLEGKPDSSEVQHAIDAWICHGVNSKASFFSLGAAAQVNSCDQEFLLRYLRILEIRIRMDSNCYYFLSLTHFPQQMAGIGMVGLDSQLRKDRPLALLPAFEL